MTQAATDLLSGLAPTEGIKDEGDFLGGYSPFESDLYDFTVELAYFSLSKGGAKCLNVTFKQDKRELKQQFWITSGAAKGCLPYYVNQRTGERQYLPGYIAAKHLVMLTANGKELHQLTIENRHIKLYSKEAKAEVATEVPMAIELLGKPVTAGVIKRLVDRTQDSGTVDEKGNKIYTPTGETRFENEVVKFFRTRDKMTVTEIMAKAEKAEFAQKWLDKFFGSVEDKRAKNTGTAGAVAGGGAVPTVPVQASAAVAGLFN